MKILVISLLRLGDIIQIAPILAGLKKEDPKNEVHLLINSQFSGLRKILPAVDKIHLFERDILQTALGEADRPVFEAFDRCRELIDSLQDQGYDRIINLTHNRLSGWLTTLIGAKDISGLSYTSGGSPLFGGSWFRYLNSQMSVRGGEPFHYADALYFATGLSEKRHPIVLRETESGIDAAEQKLRGLNSFIAIQPFTSDPKKNWPLKKYLETIRTVAQLNPSLQFVILGSPAEGTKLHQFVQELRHGGLKALGLFENLETTLSIVKRARLLLTGDTSIKHLAAATDTQIVELSLGSRDYRKTGAYKPGSVILQPHEECAPCPHSSPCSRSSHACAETLSSELVSLVIDKLTAGRPNELRLLAREFEDEAEIVTTALSESGYWTFHSVLPRDGEKSIARLLDLSSWKMFLQPDPQAAVGEFGTEGLRVRRSLKAAYPETSQEEWLDQVHSLENELERFESRLDIFLVDFKAYLKKFDQSQLFEQLCERLKGYFEKTPPGHVVSSYQREILGVLGDLSQIQDSDFLKIRKLNDGLLQAHQRLGVELRLLKSFKTGLMENA
ncbi:MAG: glycosyltransferase family 9 protein [Bdellovibrionia bacterium]